VFGWTFPDPDVLLEPSFEDPLELPPELLGLADPLDPELTLPPEACPDPLEFAWPLPLLLPGLFPLPLVVLPFPEEFPFDPVDCEDVPLLELIWDPCPCVWLPVVVLVFPLLLPLLLEELPLLLFPPPFFPLFLSFFEPSLPPLLPLSLLLTELPNPLDMLLIALIDCAMFAIEVTFITVETMF
jgi:hypothetical protein